MQIDHHTITLSENLVPKENAHKPRASQRLLLAFGLVGIVALVGISSQQTLPDSQPHAGEVKLEVNSNPEEVVRNADLVFDGPEFSVHLSNDENTSSNTNNENNNNNNENTIGNDSDNTNNNEPEVDPYVALDVLVGKWVCSDVSSNFGSFMEKTGVSWVTRSMAKTMGYGKGSSKQTLTRNGDEFTIVSEGSPTVTTRVSLRGVPFVTETSLGTSIVTGHMVNAELHITAKKNTKVVQTVHKMEGDVRVQAMSVEGVNAWRKWKRA